MALPYDGQWDMVRYGKWVNELNQQQKTMAWRSSKYSAWIRTLPCAFPECGKVGPSHQCHIKGAGNFSGIALKASDILSFPGCMDCHDKLHAGEIPLERQFEMVCRTVSRAVQDGILKVK